MAASTTGGAQEIPEDLVMSQGSWWKPGAIKFLEDVGRDEKSVHPISVRWLANPGSLWREKAFESQKALPAGGEKFPGVVGPTSLRNLISRSLLRGREQAEAG